MSPIQTDRSLIGTVFSLTGATNIASYKAHLKLLIMSQKQQYHAPASGQKVFGATKIPYGTVFCGVDYSTIGNTAILSPSTTFSHHNLQ
jgi:hypothetical protein